jgi:ribosome-associated heat shock protein Hsp15
MSDASAERVRLDTWLWAARLCKTRSLAADAARGGRVTVNGARAKPAKPVAPGDRIRLRQGPFEYLLTVRAVSDRRGPARGAAELYAEDEAGRERRRRLAEQHRLAAASFAHGEGKPTKKQRRELRRLKGVEE